MLKQGLTNAFERSLFLIIRAMPALIIMLVVSQFATGNRLALAVAALTATKTDALVVDMNGNTQLNMGDTLEYTVTIANPGASDQINAAFNDTVDSNTTLVPGSVKTTPIARNDSGYSTVGNVQLTVPVGSSVLNNDNDPDGSGAVTPTGVSGCADVTAPFVCAAASASGGDVTLNADGSFTFNPAPGFSGTDTFTYTVQDTDGNSDPATVSVTVGTPVWFINNSAGAGDGRFTSPFNSVAAFSASPLDEAGDYIFVYQGAGAYTGTIALLNNQQLIGHGVGLTIAPNLSIAAGTRPTLANITLASGNTVRGLNVSASSGTAISGASVGSLTINNVSVTNTNGVGVSLANGALSVTFDSVSASSAANGIVLNTTTGSFTVTGTGGTCTAANTSGCSGGVIANLTGADNSTATPGGTGIVLNNVTNVSLTRMYIHDASNYGIRGTSVNGFTLDTSVVGGTNGTNVASPYNDSSILFDNLSGTSAITNSDISGGYFRNIHIDNTTGTLTFTVNNNLIHNTGATQGDDGLFVEIGGGNATLTVTNNTFTAHGGDHFNLSMLGSPTVGLTFTGNLWTGGHAIGLGQGLFILAASFNSPGTFTYNISNNGTALNPLVGNRQGGAMHVNKGSGTGSFSGTISNNFIGNAAVNGSGSSEASGIDVESHGAGGSHTTLITNNTVRQFHNDGILLVAGEGSATFNATVTGNTVTNPDSSIASLHGMHFNIGTLPTDNMTACLDVKNNSLSAAGAEGNGGVDLRMRQRQLTTVGLPGYGGANNDNAAVQTFLSTTNGNTVTTILASNTVATGGGGYTNPGASCPQPSAALPTRPVARVAPRPVSAFTLPDFGGFLSAASDKAARLFTDLAAAARIRTARASGETVNVTLGTLNPGQSVAITFRVTVDNPVVPANATQVSNQGTVTADGGISVLTDDPDVGGATDPTVTPLADEIPPDSTIDSNPPDPDNDATPTFTFSGTDNISLPANLTFECQIDGGGFSACASPHTTAALGDGSHTFEVRATDEALNVDASPASYTWTIDTTAPDTTIDSNPSNPTNSASAAFTFSGSDPGGSGVAGFECQLDGGGFSACTSPKNYSSLGDGSHTFEVRAVDNAGNTDASPASFIWTVDATGPDTIIDTNPSDPTVSTSASFTFHGDDGGGSGVASFECQLDGGGFSACSSPQNYSGLGEGSHTFQVRAIDTLGNADATPASFTWTIDLSVPDTIIDTTPSNPTNSSSASFTFHGDDGSGSGIAGFECQLDGGGFSACSSPQNYSSLGAGSHTFQVRAIDNVGNTDPSSASFTWMIDLTAPDVTVNQAAGQADPTTAAIINFTVVFSEPVSGFGDSASDVSLGGSAGPTTAVVTEIAPMDGTTYNVAVSGMTVSGMVTASIPASAATDTAGNGNNASTGSDNTVNWILDNTPPDTFINSNPADPTNLTSASFAFSGTDDNTPSGSLTFECQLDGGGFSACASPQNYSGLGVGFHTFDVRATDGAGNTDSTPASYTWEIIPGPTVTVLDGVCSTANAYGYGKLKVQLFNVDGDPMTVTLASNSNPYLVPNAGVRIEGFGTIRTISVKSVFGRTGTTTLTFNVSDGTSITPFVVTVQVGTSGNDTLNGTSGTDMIFGLNGNDTLSGGDGDDLLCGNSGNDTLNGDAGNDILDGGNGNDILNGGDDNDIMRGGYGADTMTGGLGADFFSGGYGVDVAVDFNPGEGDKKDPSTP